MNKKSILIGVSYIVLVILFLALARLILSTLHVSNLSDGSQGYTVGLIVFYVLFGALLGIPLLIKSLSTPGKVKLNIVSLVLAIIALTLPLTTSIAAFLIPVFGVHYDIGTGFFALILLGFSLATIVKKEPAIQNP